MCIRRTFLLVSALVVLPSAAALDDPSSFFPVVQTTEGDYLKKVVDLANRSEGVTLSIDKSPELNQYELSGEINGDELLGPLLLWTFDEKYYSRTKHRAETDYSVLDGVLFDGIIRIYENKLVDSDEAIAEMAEILVHEALHAIIAKKYPEFYLSGACDDCQHRLIYSLTATELCRAANECPDEGEEGLSPEQRDLLKDESDDEVRKCEDAEAENPCAPSKCSLAPPIPECPEPCELMSCDQ